jgi:hypothetical protein
MTTDRSMKNRKLCRIVVAQPKSVMQVAKSFLIFFVAIVGVNCSHEATNQERKETLEISVSRTTDGSSIIAGRCFDFSSRSSLIPASFDYQWCGTAY